MKSPSPNEIRDALRDWLPKTRLSFERGWNTRGRPWSGGIRGVVVHHWAGMGDGGAAWMAQHGTSAYPYCNAIVRRDGRVRVLSALSAWHSGTGGPWEKAGIPKDVGHLYLWGIEMEGPLPTTRYGVDDMTPAQWGNTARMICAIREVAGPEAFPGWSRVIRHGDWTDGTAGVSSSPLPTRGRKNDVWRPTKEIRKLARDRWEHKLEARARREARADG